MFVIAIETELNSLASCAETNVMTRNGYQIITEHEAFFVSKERFLNKYKGNLDYMLREVNATTAMQKYNKEVLRLRSDIHNGPACLRRYQCCTLCNNTKCSLSLRQSLTAG